MNESFRNAGPHVELQDAGLWRPKSSREGIGPIKYVWWNSFYRIMEFFNRAFARDPNRKVSWDQWPAYLGVLYLVSKIRFNRSNALTDPYDYAANDTKDFGAEPDAVRHDYTADGTWVSDRENPQTASSWPCSARQLARQRGDCRSHREGPNARNRQRPPDPSQRAGAGLDSGADLRQQRGGACGAAAFRARQDAA
jgi:hypothetical protein